MATLERELRAVVENAIVNQPRSQQKLIGPSEIGMPCVRCLGHKLASMDKIVKPDWMPFVGTCVHAQLDEIFTNAALVEAADGENPRWLSECKVDVGTIDGATISGSCDLFDTLTGTVIDFKVVGVQTLREAKLGPSEQYRVQVHSYGRGWAHAGYVVNEVAIWYLPRNAVSLSSGIFWHEPYDEVIAKTALVRAEALAVAIRTVGASVILPTLQRAPGCYDCPRYPTLPGETPAITASKTDDLFAGLASG